MTSPVSSDALTCPQCLAPMRLIMTVPTVSEDSPIETRTFACNACETTVALNGPAWDAHEE
jgi:hypothetical protein